MSLMNLSGYVGHATIFILMLTIACRLVVGLWLGLYLVYGWYRPIKYYTIGTQNVTGPEQHVLLVRHRQQDA